MNLMPSTLAAKLPLIDSTENEPEDKKLVLAHYFSASWDWYATEYDPVDRVFFGLVDGFELEYGYFSLAELESVKPKGFRMGIELDLYWDPKPVAQIHAERTKLRMASG